MYRTAEELLTQAQDKKVPLWQIVLENEMDLTEKTEEAIFERLLYTYNVMERSATKALTSPQHAIGGLITGVSQIQNNYSKKSDSLCGSWVNHSMAMAFSSSEVNASMGKICAAPTAGACGILPAVLISVRKKYNLTERETLCGLLTAAGVGAVITRNATVAGAEGGCQAECGVAAAMASAATVEMLHGSPEAALHSSCFCLMNAMGLVCDPVAGLVQVPCAQRNASQTLNALLSADWALAGQRSVIPPDEVIGAMYHTGKMLPTQLRETAQGGLAATSTAKSIFEDIFIKH
ncbi:MAG: L-serine ammonia-lyase, iron-sulfur-dependent, subunit alpha [Clostridium sp.]|uniref:L-serine ammonia-lyase, iron-sulfur-dependent, subunit alpha n=1 Tax=Clostridium sp. TaxID=1506 RepID=UPI00290D9947|nr:L-serine ammonia-lyase, iron-sulfur-dependent, subunit alpha [Clostridium sp.]MDU7338504.1 L-serine ammonia-lyase, iron-sulfur-dependent, subunit alpha [Clostridium sp.]